MKDLIHPIRLHRVALGLTQGGLADKIEVSPDRLFALGLSEPNVSEQWVRRLELGMVNPTLDFSPVAKTIKEEYVKRFIDRQIWEEKVSEVSGTLLGYADLLDYNQRLRLDSATAVGRNAVGHIQAQILDWYTLTRWRARVRLMVRQINFAKAPAELQPQLTKALTGRDTIYAFCRAVGLHPFSVQTWVKENETDPFLWPQAVRDALVEIGYDL